MTANGEEAVEGYLVIKVLEVAGHNKNDEPVWNSSFTRGYVKSKGFFGLLPVLGTHCVHRHPRIPLCLTQPPPTLQLKLGEDLELSRFAWNSSSRNAVGVADPVLRHQCCSSQKNTSIQPIADSSITWEEQLAL